MELSDTGELQKWAIYHPFGREMVSVSATPVLPPLGSGGVSGTHGSRYSFAWKEKDRESDVHYFEWRYYDDGSGRFTSVDPVYYEVGITERGKEALLDPEMMHPYVYGRNGPMRYVDPTGQNPIAEACIDLASAVYHVWSACGSAILYGQWVLQGNDTYKQFGAEGINSSINNAKNDVLAAAIPFYPSTGVKFLGKSIVDEFQDALKKGYFKVSDGRKDKGNSWDQIEWYAPNRNLPRDLYGNPIPDSNGAHTQLWKKDWRNGPYKQWREWGENGDLKKDTDFTNHWRPNTHTNPHSHEYTKNPTWWTPKRDKAR